MAARAPAHVTVVYLEECDDSALLLARARQAALHTPSFTTKLGEVGSDQDGRGGVWYLVIDESGT